MSFFYLNKPIVLILFFAITLNSCQLNSKSENKQEKTEEFNKLLLTEKLDSALAYLTGVCGDDGINKVCILHSGDTIFLGKDSKVVQRVWSCTKSFTSTVLGLLIADGKCNLDDKVCDYLPEMKEYYPELTFRHFATMTSGYRAIGDEPRGNYVHGPSYTPHIPSPNPLFSPGTEFRYWDSAMNMFAYALRKVAGEPINELFKKRIADPIGMDSLKWRWKGFKTDQGIKVSGGAGNNGWGISINAIEFAKFGQLMLQKGQWNGEELLPSEWVKKATSPQVKDLISDDATPYGFNWWTAGVFHDAPKGTFGAFGFNNNKCIVIPAWDLVVVRLGLDGNIDNEKWNNFIKILGEAFKV